jgi:adenylate cyclase
VPENFKRKLTAIFSADAVGYSRLMAEDETTTVKTLSSYREIMASLIIQHRGRVVDSPGDNLLAEFSSVVDAVQCAVAVQNEFQTRNAELTEIRRMEFRIGINLGDVIDEEDRIYGDGVNVAARLEALADPGGICVSKTAFDHIETKLPLGYEYLGQQSFKNIPKPVGAYRVLMKPDAVGKVIGEKRFLGRISRRTAMAAIIILVMVAGVLISWNIYLHQSKKSVGKMAFPLPDKPSIAVLPFVNMSDDPKQEYFVDGMSEDIMTKLSKSGYFFVISRNSTFSYKGTAVPVRVLARELGVEYVLEGSVHKVDDRIRITAQLIDARADKLVWAERYDREFKDVFEVQDEITKNIVASVEPEFLSAEFQRAQKRDAPGLEAWDTFMRGYWHFLRYTEKDNETAQRLLRRAIELDPTIANYHAVLAVTHLMDGFYGWGPSRDESLRTALEIAVRGLALDDRDAQVIRVPGLIHFFSRNYDTARSYFERAVATNPYEAENHALLGASFGVDGEYEAALSAFETAFRLSPRDVHAPAWYGYMAVAAFIVGRDEEAAEWARKAIEGNPQFPGGHRTLAAAYGAMERTEEAKRAAGKLLELLPHVTIAQLRQSIPYFKDPDGLERYLDGLRRAGIPEDGNDGK